MRWCPSSVLHLLRCVRLRPCIRRGRNRLPLWVREIWAYMSVLAQSLYFNSLTDSDVVFDSVFEPLFWTVDYVTRWFGTVSVYFFVFSNISHRVFLGRKLNMNVSCLCLSGFCFPGGDTGQLYLGDSLYGPTASGSQHILPSMDCLACLLWTLEPCHDCVPLLQGHQDSPWVPPYSKISTTLFCSIQQTALLI